MVVVTLPYRKGLISFLKPYMARHDCGYRARKPGQDLEVICPGIHSADMMRIYASRFYR